jgi:hypothetical protein
MSEEGMPIGQFDRVHRDELERDLAEQQELIADANIIKRGLENPPEFWNILMKYYEKQKERCHERCFNRGAMPTDITERLVDTEVLMLTYLEIKNLIDLPKHIIEKGELALEALIERGKDEQKIMDLQKANKDPIMKR